MNTHAITNGTDSSRVRWVFDEDYETVGSYAMGTEEATRAAEEREISQLASGAWIALGAIREERCENCSQWHETDSIWGVVAGYSDKLEDLAREFFTLPEGETR